MGRHLSDDEKRARKIDREIEASARLADIIGDDEPTKPPRPKQLAPKKTADEKRQRKLDNLRRWQRRYPEKARAASKRWKEENPEKVREYQRKWWREHAERKRAAKIEAERAPVRAYKKQWRRKNQERELARGRADAAKFRATNPESVRASQRKWNAANMDYKRQHDRDRYAREAEKRKAARRARYAALVSDGQKVEQ